MPRKPRLPVKWSEDARICTVRRWIPEPCFEMIKSALKGLILMRFDFQITIREEIRLNDQVVQQLTDRNIKLMFDVYSMINFIDS